jgi:hypothetical protein
MPVGDVEVRDDQGVIDNDRAISIADARERECRIQARAYRSVLSKLAPANWLLVGGAALLSTVAGATIVTTTAPHYLPASLALLSAAFTVTHKGLNCDVYQDECKRLRSAYDALACRYRSLELVESAADLQRDLRELDASQAKLRAEASVVPPDWALWRAENGDRRAIAILKPGAGSGSVRRRGNCRWLRGLWRQGGPSAGGRSTPLLARANDPSPPPASRPASSRSGEPSADSSAQHPEH